MPPNKPTGGGPYAAANDLAAYPPPPRRQLWMERGILAPGKKGIRVVNARPSRQAAFEVLKDLVSGADLTTDGAGSPAEQDQETEPALAEC